MLMVLLSIFNSGVNGLANCPASCKCDEMNLVVNCGEGHLDVLPIALNPSIKRLQIQKNKIKTIDSSVQFYSELNFLDLSFNHLINIPPRTFQYQKKLKELHLNSNKISSVNNETFIGLMTLIILDLSDNFLDELGANVFSTLPKLEEINLSKNRIHRIHEKSLNSLLSLRVLYLNDNNLNRVPSEAFDSLAALAELYLGINSFTEIENGAFMKLRGLSLLDLKGVGLSNISMDTFHGLDDCLRELDISDNRLHQVPTETLHHLTRLEKLIIGQNNFETIPSKAFNSINLRHIDISGSSKLYRIESGAFAATPSLETLSIVSNKALSEIQIGAFTGLIFLKNLNLRDNALTVIPENLVNWDELSFFDVSENPILCDCNILWLQVLLNSQNTSQMSYEKVLCSSPDSLRDQSILTLLPTKIGCNMNEINTEAMLGILLVICSVVLLLLLLALVFRYRYRLHEAFKDRWGDPTLGNKEREYQKTFSDEDYAHTHAHIPCALSLQQPTAQISNYSHHQYHQPGIRPIPVTEL